MGIGNYHRAKIVKTSKMYFDFISVKKRINYK